MADTTEPEVIELRLIPLPAARLTRAAARSWLLSWAAEYARVIACGLHVADASARDAYESLATDVSAMLAACASVIESGKAETLAGVWMESPIERPSILRQLAQIIATRPTAECGDWVEVYDVLARRLVELLGGREAA